MKKIAIGILLGIFTLSSCKKVVEEGDLDKQINIYFLFDQITSYFAGVQVANRGSAINDFDIRDYKLIDSVTLNIGIITPSLSDTAFVRLYNRTDNEEIVSARITGATKYEAIEFNSNNILQSLPQKRVSLEVQILSSTGRQVTGVTPYLKLRRK